MTKTPEEKLIELEAAAKKIAAQKRKVQAKLRTQARKDDARRKIIVGSVILAHAEHDENFAELLQTILNNRTIREADREFLGLPPRDTTLAAE